MRELKKYRAGLGTKFTFECVNEDYSQKEMLYTTKKNTQIFEINIESVFPSCLNGKVHTGLSELWSVIGPAPPISDVRFTKHMNFLENIALELCLKNMKSAGERAKCLIQKEYGAYNTDIIDLPPSFDDSWCSCKWTANRGTVSATAEMSYQVIDISYNATAKHSVHSLKNAKRMP